MSRNPETKGPRHETLSPAEQKVYFEMLPRQIVTLPEIARVTSSYGKARTLVWRLRKKGFIQTIRGGMYAVVPSEFRGREIMVEPQVVAAVAAGEKDPAYYLSHHTALEIHGIAHSAVSIAVATIARRRRNFEYQGTRYLFSVRRSRLGVESMVRHGLPLRVSDMEMTLLDCLRDPRLAGGLEEIVKSMQGAPSLRAGLLLNYLDRLADQPLVHRVGYLLSMIADDLPLPQELVTGLKSRLSRRAVYLVPGDRGGRLVKEWSIIVPRNVEALVRGV